MKFLKKIRIHSVSSPFPCVNAWSSEAVLPLPLQRGRWIPTKVEKYIFTLLFVRGCNLFLREQVFRVSPFGGGPRGRIFERIILIK